MKKILAMAVCAMFVLTASAQRASSSSSSFKTASTDEAKFQFGIRAGMNASNMKESWDGGSEKYGNKSHIGYHVGVIADVPLVKSYFYITPGLYFTDKGYKYKESEGSYEWTETANPLYLEIPILFSGRYTFGIAQLQVNFGPYFACGIAGKFKEKVKYHGDTEEEKMDFFSDELKRFDAGLSLGAGVLLQKHYYIGFQYEWGLANLYKDSDDDKVRNKNFMLTVGYNF